MQIDAQPTSVSAVQELANPNSAMSKNDFKLNPGPKVTLKVRAAKTKGVVKSIIQDWLGSQVTYIMNNLTKMTIEVDLPDLTTIFQ